MSNEIASEYMKCASDYVYFICNYLTTFDQTKGGYVPFKLFKGQQNILHNYYNERYNLTLKYRQAGITTITAAYFAWLIVFGSEEKPEKILIVANKRDTAAELLKKSYEFIQQCPDWMFDIPKENIFKKKDSEFHKIFYNKSEIKAMATSAGVFRGYSPTNLILDECAHLDGIDVDSFWSASMAAVSTGGKVSLISTPSGNDQIFWKTYNNAKNGDNDFCINEIKWYQDPRYNIGLKWVKDDDIIENWVEDEWPDLVISGYKPTSPWYEDMKRQMDSPRKVSQEIDGNFVGSGNTFISGEDIDKQERENIVDPIRIEGYDKGVWVYVDPIKGHRYGAGLDISLGQSDDWSTLTIVDFETWEQVFEWRGKMAPDVVAEYIMKYLERYGNPMLITDLTGGLGLMCVGKLKEFGYKNFFFDYGSRDVNLFTNKDDLTPGLVISSTNTRMNVLDSLERNIRQGFKVRSRRTLAEMRTFIVNASGRPDHMKGCNDDCLFSLALALYLCETRFKDLTKNDSQIKSLLNSWTLEETPHNIPTNQNQSAESKDQRVLQSQYGWLFGMKN